MRDWMGLLRAEATKAVRRRFTWGMLIALMGFMAFHGDRLHTELLDYRQAEESGVGRFGQAIDPQVAATTTADLTRRMSLPGFLDELWVITDFWGILTLLIVAALQAGEEFDGATARGVLIRGVPRGLWPVAKVTALLGLAGMFWLALAAANVGVGLWTHTQAGGSPDLGAISLQRWAMHAGRLARSWLATTPYIAFAVAAAMVARGAGPALVLGLGGRFVEATSGIVGVFLISVEVSGWDALGPWYRLWAPLHVASLEWNARVWTTWGAPAWNQALSPIPATDHLIAAPPPFHTDPWLALAVLLGWSGIWMAWAARSMSRKDITA